MVDGPANGRKPRANLRDEIVDGCAWLVRARWASGLLLLVGTAAATQTLALRVPEIELYATSAIILLSNALLARSLARAHSRDPAQLEALSARLLGLQLVFDWAALSVIVHLTGGIFSPAIPLLLIPMTIAAAAINGPPLPAWPLITAGTLAVIAALEGTGSLAHYPLIHGLPAAAYRDPVAIGAACGSALLAGTGLAYAARNLARHLRRKEDRIERLLKTIEIISAESDTGEILNALSRVSVEALGAKSAMIHLLGETSGTLSLACTCGLSETFLKHPTVALSQSVFETEIMAGQPAIINDVARDARILQPRQLVEEGLRSMIATPIIGRAQLLGVLCIYSERAHAFGTSDGEFLMALARQGGCALEHAMAYGILRKSDQDRAQFVMMVTHELRAPVAGTQVLLKTLVRGIAGDLNDQQRDILVRIEKRIEMLMALVNDLLKLAASKTTDVEEPLQRVLLRPLLHQVCDRFGKEAAVNHISVTLDMPFEAVSVRATELGLKRVIDNLVGNAVKYTPADGQVCVGVVERPSGVVITVADTGIGIPETDLPRVMDGFFRAKNARESGIIGTGLGLSIVKQFVDFFGGSISVDSVVGKGTTFKVTLQRAGPMDDPAMVTESDE